MSEPGDEEIRGLLKRAMIPVDPELKRDLWPRMRRRLEERPPTRGLWLDWALVALLTIWFLVFPEAIPILLYHL